MREAEQHETEVRRWAVATVPGDENCRNFKNSHVPSKVGDPRAPRRSQARAETRKERLRPRRRGCVPSRRRNFGATPLSHAAALCDVSMPLRFVVYPTSRCRLRVWCDSFCRRKRRLLHAGWKKTRRRRLLRRCRTFALQLISCYNNHLS